MRQPSPAAGALRRVVTLNREIGFDVRRLLHLKDTDYSAMSALMRRPLGHTELAEALHVTGAAATAVVDRLVAAGHAVREPHPDDRRRIVIRPVERSKERAMSLVWPATQIVEDEFAALDPAGQDAVLSFLTSTVHRLEAYRDELAARSEMTDVPQSSTSGRAGHG